MAVAGSSTARRVRDFENRKRDSTLKTFGKKLDVGGLFQRAPEVQFFESEIDPNAFRIQDRDTSRFDRLGLDAQRRSAPNVSLREADPAQEQAARAQQSQLAALLQQAAAGQTPSAAQLQLQGSQEANLANALALARSQSGVSPGAALQTALGSSQAANLQTQQNLAVLRAQEQAAARAQLGDVLSSTRGQDIARVGQSQDFQLSQALSNQQARLQQTQLNDQLTTRFISEGFSRDEARQLAAAELQKVAVQQDALRLQKAIADAGIQQKEKGGLLGAVGSGLSAIFG